jgi:uncharacterized membrane protein YuzA (DUF378 family)
VTHRSTFAELTASVRMSLLAMALILICALPWLFVGIARA